MKKYLIATTAALVCVAVVIGCTSYEMEAKRYEVEKKFSEAKRRLENYSVKPELRTTEDYYFLVDGYQQVYLSFIENFPEVGNKDSLTEIEMQVSLLAGQSLVTAANLYLSANLSDSAVALLNIVADSSRFARRHVNDAYLGLGGIAEQQGRWLDAEQYYMLLLENFYPPVIERIYPDPVVLALPQRIVGHYVAVGDMETARARTDWAIEYYQDMTVPGGSAQTPLSLSATRILADLFNAKGEYQKSVELLETVTDSTGAVASTARMLIADLYVTRLDRGEEAIKIYRQVLDNPNDSLLAPQVYLKLAAISFSNKNYDEGRRYLARIKKLTFQPFKVRIDAQQMLARSFEQEGEWDRAIQEYQFLMNQYPDTREALDAIVYIPELYKQFGEESLSQQWLDKTEDRLKEIIGQRSQTQFGLLASGYLGTFYARNDRFEDAIGQWEKLRRDYPKSAKAADALLKIAVVYQKSLKNKEKALETYRQFLELYPHSVVRSKVEREIRKLEQG